MIEPVLRSHMLVLASVHSAASGLSMISLGKRVANDSRFFMRIGAAKSFEARTYDRVVAWFSENWPAGAAWPVEVPRPVVVSASEAAE